MACADFFTAPSVMAAGEKERDGEEGGEGSCNAPSTVRLEDRQVMAVPLITPVVTVGKDTDMEDEYG